MSLQVWLPLNGNIKNQGLDFLEPILHSTEVYGEGKIGANSFSFNPGCLQFLWSHIASEEFSFSAWIKPNGVSAWQDILSFGEKYNRIEVDNTLTTYRWYVDNGGTPLVTSGTVIFSLSDNDWHHLTVTANGEKVYFYIDGEEKSNHSQQNSLFKAFGASLNCRIGCRTDTPSNIWKGFMNDVRLYDHALSVKEVKELAKGLILHMPLDNNGMGGVNLLKGGYSAITTKDSHSASGSLSFDTSIMPLSDLIGKTIIFSFDYKCDGPKLNDTGDYTKDRYGFHLSMTYTDANGTAGTAYPCTDYLEPVGIGRAVQKFTISSTLKSINSFSVAIQPYNRPAADNNNTWYLKNVKLEIGSKATAYSPNPTDLGEDVLAVDETSGYNRIGKSTNVMLVSSDTPRYGVSTEWKEQNDFIAFSNFFALNQQVPALTIAGWYKANTLNGTAPNFFNFGANNFVRGRIAGSSSFWSYWNIGGTKQGVSVTTPSTLDNKWHHYAFSFNKGIIKTYFDGVLKNTTDHIATGTVLTCGQIENWGLGGYNPTGEKFLGSQSDFRVYCTALSDDNILELYQGRSGVDKNGNLHMIKIQESTGIAPLVTKQHTMDVPGEFYEPTGVNLAYNAEPYDYTDIIAGYVPKKDTTNSCLSGFKVPYGVELNGKRAQATITVSWSGFDASSTAGTFAMRFQGGQMTADGGQSWTAATGKSNRLSAAFAGAQSLTALVLGSESGQTTITVEYTISAVADQPGDWLGIRTDYSNGIGQIQLSNFTVALMDSTVSDSQKFKIGEKNVVANYIYEM